MWSTGSSELFVMMNDVVTPVEECDTAVVLLIVKRPKCLICISLIT